MDSATNQAAQRTFRLPMPLKEASSLVGRGAKPTPTEPRNSYRTYAVVKKSRVRDTSSERVADLKDSDRFAQDGVKGR